MDQNLDTSVVSRIAAEVRAGLSQAQKSLPPKLFYDAEGSRLFGEITRLPEYYLTRTEMALLPRVAAAVARKVPAGAGVVEYGGSDETKALILLDALDSPAAYVPVDVAAEAMGALTERLRRSRPGLSVHPLIADFLQPITLPRDLDGLTLLGFFPGSTIGNLDPVQALGFLGAVRASLGKGALFLVGADLRKDASMLLPAYDDAAGITAAFNLNMLARLNRELGADFDLAAFAHRAVWNEAQSRIEMHLVSRRPQRVRVAGQVFSFAEGESIHTENSYKHSPASFRALAGAAGWLCEEYWADDAGLFSMHLLRSGQ